MSSTCKVLFHFYKSRPFVAAELLDDFETASVFNQIMFFCLLVSRTHLIFFETRNDTAHLTKWLYYFRDLAVGLAQGNVGPERLKLSVKNSGWDGPFGGEAGNPKLLIFLSLRAPYVFDYQFNVDEHGRFGLFGSGKHLAYSDAMAELWSVLIMSRIDDLTFAQNLNTAGYLIGEAFFNRRLTRQTEPAIIREVIDKLVKLQIRSDEATDEIYQHFDKIQKATQMATQGDTNAQYLLGSLYDAGYAVLQDTFEAARWYRKAAEKGHCQSQRLLGDKYRKGQGVREDVSTSVKWYRKAAEQGDPL